jgi:hypothetical protein
MLADQEGAPKNLSKFIELIRAKYRITSTFRVEVLDRRRTISYIIICRGSSRCARSTQRPVCGIARLIGATVAVGWVQGLHPLSVGRSQP